MNILPLYWREPSDGEKNENLKMVGFCGFNLLPVVKINLKTNHYEAQLFNETISALSISACIKKVDDTWKDIVANKLLAPSPNEEALKDLDLMTIIIIRNHAKDLEVKVKTERGEISAYLLNNNPIPGRILIRGTDYKTEEEAYRDMHKIIAAAAEFKTP